MAREIAFTDLSFDEINALELVSEYNVEHEVSSQELDPALLSMFKDKCQREGTDYDVELMLLLS